MKQEYTAYAFIGKLCSEVALEGNAQDGDLLETHAAQLESSSLFLRG